MFHSDQFKPKFHFKLIKNKYNGEQFPSSFKNTQYLYLMKVYFSIKFCIDIEWREPQGKKWIPDGYFALFC